MKRLDSAYESALGHKYETTIQNKWFWLFFALVILIATFAYAFYCTSRGYNFTGSVRLNWPTLWEMGVGCRR